MNTIRAKILCITVALVLLFCAVIIWLCFKTSFNYKALKIQECQTVINYEYEEIKGLLKDFAEEAKHLAQTGSIYHSLSSHMSNTDEKIIANNLNMREEFLGGGIWYEPYAVFPDKERVCFSVYHDAETLVYDKSFEKEHYNYLKQSWYKDIVAQVKTGKNVAWHKTYVDETGNEPLMMTVGAGIYDASGHLAGIATVDMSMAFIIEKTSVLKLTEGSIILIVNTDSGNIINVINAADMTKATDYAADDNYLKFQRDFANGVSLVIYTPKNELFSRINNQLTTALTVVAVIILGAFIGMYSVLDKFLRQPISYLSQKTKEIGLGNLDVVIDITSKDEIGELGVTINKMTADIKTYIENIGNMTKERERINSELNIANNIQQAMLPTLEHDNEGFNIYATMTPCNAVGGDFYDAFRINDNRLCVVVADVAGKGVPGALFMATAKTTIKSLAQTGLPPCEIITRANKELAKNNKARVFVTVFLGILNLKTGEFTYVNAGHNPPLLMQRGETFEYFRTKSELALAISQNMIYTQSSISLKPGGKMFFYTDGITEAFNSNQEMFQEERLYNVINTYKNCGLKEMAANIKKELDSFVGDAPIHDDITMLSFEFRGDYGNHE